MNVSSAWSKLLSKTKQPDVKKNTASLQTKWEEATKQSSASKPIHPVKASPILKNKYTKPVEVKQSRLTFTTRKIPSCNTSQCNTAPSMELEKDITSNKAGDSNTPSNISCTTTSGFTKDETKKIESNSTSSTKEIIKMDEEEHTGMNNGIVNNGNGGNTNDLSSNCNIDKCTSSDTSDIKASPNSDIIKRINRPIQKKVVTTPISSTVKKSAFIYKDITGVVTNSKDGITDVIEDERNKMLEKEHEMYITAVKEHLRDRHAITPRGLVFDLKTIDATVLTPIFEQYIASFPSGMFALVYSVDSQVTVTKFKSMYMMALESDHDMDYKFTVSKSNMVIFTLDNECRFKNKVVIMSKHRVTTIMYNLKIEVNDLDTKTTTTCNADSIQLFR